MFEYKTVSIYRRKTIRRKRPLSHKRGPRKKQKTLWSGITKFSYKIEIGDEHAYVARILCEVFEKSWDQAARIVNNCPTNPMDILWNIRGAKGINMTINTVHKEGTTWRLVEIEKNEKEFVA